MTDITKIALTGGPCAGKSSAVPYLTARLAAHGVEVIAVPEQATALMSSGKTPENMGSLAFHSLLFGNQLAAEEAAEKRAQESTAKKVLILCDRGLLDSRAYVSAVEFAQYAGAYGFTEAKIRNRYDAVLHMVTAADGAENAYTLRNNAARAEDAQQARELDEGLPEPLEIERKFLIEHPDLTMLQSMKACRRVPLTQAYLNTPEEGRFRVRKRGEGADALYIKTVKHKINDMKRIEIEDYISEEEYKAYLNRKEYVQGVISKDRYCLVWHSEYFELDVYPFWADKATLELELLSENQPFELPDFLTLIRDVTTEKAYRNKQLAVTYGKLFR